MSRIALDLRQITGAITLDTPLFVTIYIGTFLKLPYKDVHYQADYHYTEIIKQIELAPWPEILTPSLESENTDLARLIKFISPFSASTEWYSDTIIEGYQHLMTFSEDKDLPQLNKEIFIFGSKTSINPNKFNEIIVFRIIKSLGYIYDRYTTFEECCSFIEKYYTSNINILKTSLLYTIKDMDDTLVLKIYNFVNSLKTIDSNNSEIKISASPGKQRFQIDPVKLTFTIGELTDRKKIITKIVPSTAYEAIIVCAIKYDIDVSTSSQPMKEFDNLRKRTYIPFCSDFARRISINRKHFTISKNWSPHLLTSHIYTDEQLRAFVIEEGYSNTESLSQRDLITQLKSTKRMTNIIPGIHPDCELDSTIMLTPLNSLNKDEILCFGVEDEETKQRLYNEIENDSDRRRARITNKHNLQYTTITELLEYWRSEKIFISPSSGEQFDQIVIEKLKRYCTKLIADKSQTSSSARLMLSTIDDLKNISSILDSKLISLKKKVKECKNIEVKENVQFFFNKCLEFSLYLRGWKVISDNYPLKSGKMSYDPTMILSRDRNPFKKVYGDIEYTAHQFVMDHSYLALEEALNILKEIPEELAMDIKQLYSLRFDTKKNKKEIMGMIFSDVHVNHKETLLDCMQNIFKGISNIESCMNTNSNWILFSSAWYMTVLGYSIPFSLSDIDTVF